MAHPPEKQAAVMAALLVGQGVAQVSEEFKLPHQTVSRWKAMLDKAGAGDFGREKLVGKLIGDYVVEALTTLTEQLGHFRSAEYTTSQSADQIAVLHGVIMDKVIRILEAAERAGAFAGATQEPPSPGLHTGSIEELPAP